MSVPYHLPASRWVQKKKGQFVMKPIKYLLSTVINNYEKWLRSMWSISWPYISKRHSKGELNQLGRCYDFVCVWLWTLDSVSDRHTAACPADPGGSLSFLYCRYCLWTPSSEISGKQVKLTTHSHLVPSQRTRGAVIPFPPPPPLHVRCLVLK